MDETRTREQIDSHADAVERGDFDAVAADLSEELRPQAPEIVKSLPQPVTSATVVDVDFADDDPLTLARDRWAAADRPRRAGAVAGAGQISCGRCSAHGRARSSCAASE